MSEIKGQLLGIVLVVAVFGVVGGVLVTAFKASANNIATSVKKEYNGDVGKDGKLVGTDPTSNETDNYNSIVSNDTLLTF